jgi:hypothetical protein
VANTRGSRGLRFPRLSRGGFLVRICAGAVAGGVGQDLRGGPAAGEVLCEMAPCGPLYSRKGPPQPQAPSSLLAGFGGVPVSLLAGFVEAASSRGETRRHHQLEQGVVHGVSLCGNKADRREPSRKGTPHGPRPPAPNSERPTPNAQLRTPDLKASRWPHHSRSAAQAAARQE